MSFFGWCWLRFPEAVSFDSPVTADANDNPPSPPAFRFPYAETGPIKERLVYLTNYHPRVSNGGTATATIYLCSTTPQHPHRFLPLAPATSATGSPLYLSPSHTTFSTEGHINFSHPVDTTILLSLDRQSLAIPPPEPVEVFGEPVKLDDESHERFMTAACEYRRMRIDRRSRAKKVAPSSTNSNSASDSESDDDDADTVINALVSNHGTCNTPVTTEANDTAANAVSWAAVVRKGLKPIDSNASRFWTPKDDVWTELLERGKQGKTSTQPFGFEGNDERCDDLSHLPSLFFRPCRFAEIAKNGRALPSFNVQCRILSVEQQRRRKVWPKLRHRDVVLS